MCTRQRAAISVRKSPHVNWLTDIQTGESENPFIQWQCLPQQQRLRCSCRKKEEKLTPGTNFSRHERASFIPATFKMLNVCPPVQSPHPLLSCRGKTMLWYLKNNNKKKKRASDAPVHAAAITHRRARPPVCASRTQTCWIPAGGWRQSWDRRGFCCVRFSLGHCRVCC